MAWAELARAQGRSAFGADAENYDQARPAYPDRVFEVLRETCGLGPGTRTFEVGAGSGLATRELLRAGAAPLLAIEPDVRLADVLRRRSPETSLEIVTQPFEEVELSTGYDLGTSATAFHWIGQRKGLAKVAAALRPGGFWAMWWNVFGDPERPDAFHDATLGLLSGMASHKRDLQRPFALDQAARIGDLRRDGLFEGINSHTLKWTLVLDPAQVRALYATYSQFAMLDDGERTRLLDGLEDIAATQFGGRVERNMCTPLYTARRR